MERQEIVRRVGPAVTAPQPCRVTLRSMHQAVSGLVAFAMLMVGVAFANARLFAGALADSRTAAAYPAIGAHFPYLSLLALAYPVYAIISADGPDATLGDVLGAGLSALGDLLSMAALFFGRFAVLGLHTRRYTGLCAFAFWIVGLALGSRPLTALIH